MGRIELVYDKMPIFAQNLMISVKGMLNHRERYGKAYHEHLDFLKEFETWDLDEKLAYQETQFLNFFRYTVENSKFYRELYHNIDIASIKTITDIKKLPIVDKEMLRANMEDVSTIPSKGCIEGHTGGTTGKSLVVRMTQDDMMKRMAALDFFKFKVGFEHLKMRRATFNGKHIIPRTQKRKVFWRYNASCKQMIFSSFHISDVNLNYYVAELNRFKPQALDGFFTCMCDVANYIERKGIKLTFQPIAIFPTSETLTDEGRTLLERVFKCKVFDQYASSEGAPFVVECENQTLHMDLSSGIFEHFEEGSDEVLVTSFTTYGTPLIRYRIGDAMEFVDKDVECSCNNNQPIIKRILGRKADILYTAEGNKISLGIASILKSVPNAIIRAQFIQENTHEVIVLLEIDKGVYKAEFDDLIRNDFCAKFGTSTNLIIKHVDEIPREASGKYRMVKNSVKLEG